VSQKPRSEQTGHAETAEFTYTFAEE